MLRNRGLDRSALTIAIISAATPLLLPCPGSAIQHTSQAAIRNATGNVSHLRRAIIPNNVVRRLEREGNFRLFLQALRDTGMQSMLETGRGPFTVFAPTDRAFASLSRETFTQLFQNKARLKNILQYHIVRKRVSGANIKFDSLRTLGGQYLMTNVTNNKAITVAGAVVIKQDMQCRNGVVHSIDSVLFPLTGMETLAMSKGVGTGDKQ